MQLGSQKEILIKKTGLKIYTNKVKKLYYEQLSSKKGGGEGRGKERRRKCGRGGNGREEMAEKEMGKLGESRRKKSKGRSRIDN